MTNHWAMALAIVGVVWAAEACTTEPSCGYGLQEEPCARGATIPVTAPLAAADVAGAKMIACRNGDCATLALSVSDSSTCTTTVPGSSISVRCDPLHGFEACGFDASVVVEVPSAELVDGDTYSVRIFLAGSDKPVYEWSHAVTYNHITYVCRTQCTYANTTRLGPSTLASGCGADGGVHLVDGAAHDTGADGAVAADASSPDDASLDDAALDDSGWGQRDR